MSVHRALCLYSPRETAGREELLPCLLYQNQEV